MLPRRQLQGFVMRAMTDIDLSSGQTIRAHTCLQAVSDTIPSSESNAARCGRPIRRRHLPARGILAHGLYVHDVQPREI
jgi:hypothetical protein